VWQRQETGGKGKEQKNIKKKNLPRSQTRGHYGKMASKKEEKTKENKNVGKPKGGRTKGASKKPDKNEQRND